MKMLKTAFISLFLVVSGIANAGLMVQSDQLEQTVDFQDFGFDWVIEDWMANTDANLIIEVQGDLGFSNLSSGETFDIILESLDLGTHGAFSNGLNGWTELTANMGINAWHTSRTFNITALQMASILNDNLFQLAVNFNQGVHVGFGSINNTAPFVKATLEYTATEVPEPSTIAMFGLALLGLAARKSKKA